MALIRAMFLRRACDQPLTGVFCAIRSSSRSVISGVNRESIGTVLFDSLLLRISKSILRNVDKRVFVTNISMYGFINDKSIVCLPRHHPVRALHISAEPRHSAAYLAH